jgi:hypothetical protein
MVGFSLKIMASFEHSSTICDRKPLPSMSYRVQWQFFLLFVCNCRHLCYPTRADLEKPSCPIIAIMLLVLVGRVNVCKSKLSSHLQYPKAPSLLIVLTTCPLPF